MASEDTCICSNIRRERERKGSDRPSDELVQNFDIFANVVYLGRFFRAKDGKRADGSTVIDVAASWLNETTDKDGFKKRVCIFE